MWQAGQINANCRMPQLPATVAPLPPSVPSWFACTAKLKYKVFPNSNQTNLSKEARKLKIHMWNMFYAAESLIWIVNIVWAVREGGSFKRFSKFPSYLNGQSFFGFANGISIGIWHLRSICLCQIVKILNLKPLPSSPLHSATVPKQIWALYEQPSKIQTKPHCERTFEVRGYPWSGNQPVRA